MPELFLEPRLQRADGGPVDAVSDADPAEHEQQVLGRDIAGGARRKRTAADAAGAGVEDRHAGKERGVGVCIAGVPRIVEMGAHRHIARDRAQRAEEIEHLARHADADGVGERDFVRPGAHGLADNRDHGVRRHCPLERAAERHRHRDGCGPSRLPCHRRDTMPVGDCVGDRAALITLAEGLACDDHVTEVIAPCRDRPLGAARIEHQPGIGHAAIARHRGHDGFRVGHLRNAGRADEARRFDAAHARPDQRFDEPHLVRGRDQHALVLEPVARRHLVDRHPLRQARHIGGGAAHAAAVAAPAPSGPITPRSRRSVIVA